MKIEPVKNYKKPGYAVKLAALIAAAGALTACGEAEPEGATSLPDDITAGSTTTLDPEVQIDGGMVVVEDETTEPPVIAGEVTIEPDGTTEVQLAGDVAVITDGDLPFAYDEDGKGYEMGSYYADYFIDAFEKKGYILEKCGEGCYGEYEGVGIRPVLESEHDKILVAFFSSECPENADCIDLAAILKDKGALKEGNTYVDTVEYKGELYLIALVDIADDDVLSFEATAQLVKDCMP